MIRFFEEPQQNLVLNGGITMATSSNAGRPRSLRSWISYLFSNEGRIGRGEYSLTHIGVIVGFAVVYVLLIVIFGGVNALVEHLAPKHIDTVVNVTAPIFFLGIGFAGLGGVLIWGCSIVKRFHDLNMSGWWMFALLAPLVGLFLDLMLRFAGGEPTANKYGTRLGHSQPSTPVYDAAPGRRHT